MTWDITVVSTAYACSFLPPPLHSAAGTAELAISWKEAKYSCHFKSVLFVPITLETLWHFFTEVESRYSTCMRDGILVSAHLGNSSAVQCGTPVFCRTRRRVGHLAITTCVFTTLHGTRTQSSDENSVCPSLHPSVRRMNCDKMEEKSFRIFIPYERSFSLVFRENEWLVGRPLLPEILGQSDRIGAKSPIFSRYSLVAPQP